MMLLPKEKGQGLVEYALILVLVAIVTVSALVILEPYSEVIANWVESVAGTIVTAVIGSVMLFGYILWLVYLVWKNFFKKPKSEEENGK